MKASELVGNSRVKLLLYGDSGSGKTCLAAGMPGPIEYWDFDHKISSAVNFYKGDKLLENIEVHQFAALPKDKRITSWQERTRLIDKTVADGGKLPFATLVLDSITTLSHYMMEEYLRLYPGAKRPMVGQNIPAEYGLYFSDMKRLLTGILSLDCNVVVLAHVSTEKDDNTGMISKEPLVTGNALRPYLAVWFEEIYCAQVTRDGKFEMQTRPENGYVCRTQRGLPKRVPTSAKELFKN